VTTDRTYRQLQRCIQLLEHLRACRYMPTLPELATRFEVHPRTMRRDIAALVNAGVTLPPARPVDSTAEYPLGACLPRGAAFPLHSPAMQGFRLSAGAR
jgi:predicted DNA-binding transcriptional regulator YafY